MCKLRLHTPMTWFMIDHMEITRRSWAAAVKLAVVLSVLAAALAWAAFRIGGVPQFAVVVPVSVVAFVASWIQTGRIHRRAGAGADMVPVPAQHPTTAA